MNHDLEAHPFACQFDMIDDVPALDGLKASIRKEGILQKIVIFEDKILDGRNRYKAASEVGHCFTPADFELFKGDREKAKAYVNDANIHRRHLVKEQKGALVQKALAANPELSNRQIALRCGVSHALVNTIRRAKPKDDDPAYTSIRKAWERLADHQRERFVADFASDLAEMLAGVDTTFHNPRP